ncbi:MAG: hypothetical protein KA981_07630 [Bacteroidia bacterium]|nr:hypothetical protein [Bacteroidia bacterium]
MKNFTQLAVVLMALTIMSKLSYAEQKDSSYVLPKKHLTFKFDVFSSINSCISIAIEKDIGYRQSLEIGLGHFDGESDPDFIKENGGISGSFIRLGLKHLINRKYFEPKNVKNANFDFYIRPDMVAQYCFLSQPRSYDFITNTPYTFGNETHEYVSFGTILNFGYQQKLGERIIVDGFVGLGITYLIEVVKQTAYPYYYATLENTYMLPVSSSSRGIGLGSQAGMKIGIRIF